ncbi:MAG: transcription repressor NadR [Oscillospiraceae bacterium]|nr:transcription repressor NadR [Oscillospiraceae bacterium]
MKAEERRAKILRLLQEHEEPLSGSALAGLLGVSRQIVVQDMALLRAGTDFEIVSTYQGYVLLKKETPCRRVFKVRHGTERTQDELQQIVDLGGRVEDVFVCHSVYGEVRGQLGLSSRRDVAAFLKRLAESSSAPLMLITDEYHYHTVTAGDEATLDAIEEALQAQGYLAPLLEHEPDGVNRR